MQEEEKKDAAPEAVDAQPSDASKAPEDSNAPKDSSDPKAPQNAGDATASEAADVANEAPASETAEASDDASQSGAASFTEAAPAEPDWKDRYARAMADFDNFRKRTLRDRDELAKFAASDILKDLLPTVDNLALALDKAENKEDPFVQGVKLAYDGFLKALADHGATPLDSVGEPFDANYHEALAQLPSPDVEEGHVMNEVKRGWLLNGKLLRAAQVVVSAGKPA